MVDAHEGLCADTAPRTRLGSVALSGLARELYVTLWAEWLGKEQVELGTLSSGTGRSEQQVVVGMKELVDVGFACCTEKDRAWAVREVGG